MTEKCIEFKGAKDKKGYGVLWYKGKTEKAHRIAYSLFNGPLHWTLTIDHLCRNHSCINPKHLEAVSSRTNVLRGNGLAAQNAKKTHCSRGHKYEGDNVRVGVSPNGKPRRTCRICIRTKNKTSL